MEIFKKEYSIESLCDIERDLIECFDPRFNTQVKGCPMDMEKGKVIITVTYTED
jgi:hypothetical protein